MYRRLGLESSLHTGRLFSLLVFLQWFGLQDINSVFISQQLAIHILGPSEVHASSSISEHHVFFMSNFNLIIHKGYSARIKYYQTQHHDYACMTSRKK